MDHRFSPKVVLLRVEIPQLTVKLRHSLHREPNYRYRLETKIAICQFEIDLQILDDRK